MKRLIVSILALIFIAGITLINQKPVFFEYADNLTLYLNSPSSNATIVQVEKGDFTIYHNVRGESFSVESDKFSIDVFLKELGATVKFTERIEEGIGIYAYTPKIKYRITVGGEVVNLHIFFAEKNVTVGTPIIFGGF